VAVVDLNEVAKRLGRLGEISDALRQREVNLHEQLGSLQTSARKFYQDELEKMGEPPSDDDVKLEEHEQKVRVVQQQINVQFQQARRRAQSHLSSYEQTLVARFREEVRPVARKIAAERGMTVVFPKTENIAFWANPKLDITEDVIEQMVSRSSP